MAVSFTMTSSIRATQNGTVQLNISVTGQNVSSKVFAIEVYPASADADNPDYRFSHVCSPMELNEFPEDEPGGNCYFRVSDIEMIFDTTAMADHVISVVTKDLRFLKNEINKLENTTPETKVVSI